MQGLVKLLPLIDSLLSAASSACDLLKQFADIEVGQLVVITLTSWLAAAAIAASMSKSKKIEIPISAIS